MRIMEVDSVLKRTEDDAHDAVNTVIYISSKRKRFPSSDKK
jgi:hypothetical protein